MPVSENEHHMNCTAPCTVNVSLTSLFVSHLQRNLVRSGWVAKPLQLTDIYWAHTHTSLHGTRYSSKKISCNKERRRNQERMRRRSICGAVKRSPWPWIRWGLGRGRCVFSASLVWHGSGTPPVSLSSPGVSSPGPSCARTPPGNWPPPCRIPSGTWWKPRRRPWLWGPRHSSSSWPPGWGM